MKRAEHTPSEGKKKMKKTQIQEMKQSLFEKMNDLSIDFVGDYSITKHANNYIGDAFSEYADGAISLYTSDQLNYFSNNIDACTDALLELYDANELAETIRRDGLIELERIAGVSGAYRANYDQLSSDEKNIYRCLLLDYILENFNKFTKLSLNKLNDILESMPWCDRFDDILEAII